MKPRCQRGFAFPELLLLILLLALLISILLPSITRARQQAKKAFCANNLSQFGRAVHVYAGEYRFFCPHNPYPTYQPDKYAGQEARSLGMGFDPSIGWLLTYAMRITPPAQFSNKHFQWFVLDEDEVPDVVVCPAAHRKMMFEPNPELAAAPWEGFAYQYAAFYQCSGTIRCATPTQQARRGDTPAIGGRNAVFPDPRKGLASAQVSDNAVGSVPYVRVAQQKPEAAPDDPAAGQPVECWIQAVDPSQIDNPGRVYYMADSREYRPKPGAWPPGTTQAGWYADEDNRLFLGTRHRDVANVSYMDGHVSSDNLAPAKGWELGEPAMGWDDWQNWRSSTFQDPVRIAGVGTVHHIMPVLNVRGWESLFGQR